MTLSSWQHGFESRWGRSVTTARYKRIPIMVGGICTWGGSVIFEMSTCLPVVFTSRRGPPDSGV